MKHPITFLFRAAMAGLLVALLVLILRPDLLTRLRPVVEIREGSTALLGGASGPVSYADAVAAAAPAVVNIYTGKRIARADHPFLSDPVWREFYGDPDSQTSRLDTSSLGSGVLLSNSGYILTNYHVIEGADAISIALTDGRIAPALVVGSDRETDLAVLHIELGNLPSITLGHSEQLRVGDVVMAIGNPFNVGQTVTMGIVSATGRSELGINTFENFIQTDAAINLGNSGGALINALGELIGINTAIFSRSGGSQGIGFAIPIRLARGVMEQIIEHGRVVRGWFGVETRDLDPALAEALALPTTQGALIATVLPGSPAQRAGLLQRDLIAAIDGQAIADSRDLLNRVTALRPGQQVRVNGLREGRPFTIKVQVDVRPPH